MSSVTRKDGASLEYVHYASIDSNPNNREQLWKLADGTNALREFDNYNRLGQPEILKESPNPGSTNDYVRTTRVFYTDPTETGAKYGYLKSETMQVYVSIDRNGIINLHDFMLLTREWLRQTEWYQ